MVIQYPPLISRELHCQPDLLPFSASFNVLYADRTHTHLVLPFTFDESRCIEVERVSRRVVISTRMCFFEYVAFGADEEMKGIVSKFPWINAR